MTRRLLRLRDLEYQEPSKYCKHWEANSLAAVARAVGSAEYCSPLPLRNTVEVHKSIDGLLVDKGLKSEVDDGLPAAKRPRTGLDVGAADRVSAAGQLQHACIANAQQQPAAAAAQKHVRAHTQHLRKQATLQGSRHTQLPTAFASMEVPQRQEQAQHWLTDNADATASCSDHMNSALCLHTHLLHDAASKVALSCPGYPSQYASPARVQQPVHQQPAVTADKMGSCSTSGPHLLRLVEAFSQELSSLPPVPRKQQQVHNDLLLFYLQAAAAGPLQQSVL